MPLLVRSNNIWIRAKLCRRASRLLIPYCKAESPRATSAWNAEVRQSNRKAAKNATHAAGLTAEISLLLENAGKVTHRIFPAIFFATAKTPGGLRQGASRGAIYG